MSIEEQDATIGRLMREHKNTAQKRLYAAERVKQIAQALKRLAEAIDRRPNFEEVSRDSVLQEYLDLSKIGMLVIEEQELMDKQLDYEERLKVLGFLI
jgi:hypothetical protein